MANTSEKQPWQQPDTCTAPYRIGHLCRHKVSSVVLGLIGISISHMIHIPTRLPHDVIVEEGLPPNLGPPTSRLLEEPEEKRRRQHRIAEEDGGKEQLQKQDMDHGSTPGYYKHGKREVKGSQREEGQWGKL